MDVLSFIDMFGQTINFSIQGKAKYQTLIGAFFSIVTFTVAVVFFVIFGKDFFYHINPKISSKTTFYEKGVKANLTSAKFNYAWRLTNTAGKEKISDKMHHLIHVAKMTPNSSELKVINASKCSNKSNPYIAKQFKSISDYYCIDATNDIFRNELFGGDLSMDYLNYIYVILSRCDYQNNCFNKTEIKRILQTNNYSVEFIYPSFFSPESSDEDQIIYFSKRYPLDFVSTRNDFIYLQSLTLVDDQGWIVEDKSSDEKIITSYMDTSYLNAYNEDEKYEHFLGTMIKVQNYKTVYTKSYMKIQDLTAQLGGFMKAISSAASFLVFYFNSYSRKLFLFNFLFENNIKQRKEYVSSKI